jgi:hypothetical protein
VLKEYIHVHPATDPDLRERVIGPAEAKVRETQSQVAVAEPHADNRTIASARYGAVREIACIVLKHPMALLKPVTPPLGGNHAICG